MPGNSIYLSLSEAKASIQKLDIKNSTDYKLRRKEDPRLPASPDEVYASEWISWYDLCGDEKPVEKYPTLTLAKASARQIGIISSSEYKRRYQNDPQLLSSPDEEYAHEWISSYEFCGTKKPTKKYSTLIQAKASVRKLGIKNSRAYRLRWQEDPKLPANPYIEYALLFFIPNFPR